jgi:hypothetical protein
MSCHLIVNGVCNSLPKNNKAGVAPVASCHAVSRLCGVEINPFPAWWRDYLAVLQTGADTAQCSEHHNVGICGTTLGVLLFVYRTLVMLSYNIGVEDLSYLAYCVVLFMYVF